MQLFRDHSPGAFAVEVRCSHCLRMLSLSEAVMDQDGPSFNYYHNACMALFRDTTPNITDKIKRARCSNRDCRICN